MRRQVSAYVDWSAGSAESRIPNLKSQLSRRILQRDARVDQSHAVGAVGREIDRPDAVITRKPFDPRNHRIKTRGLEADAHARRADRFDAFQRTFEPGRASGRIRERKQRTALTIAAALLAGRTEAIDVGRGDAHEREIAPLRIDFIAKLRALDDERMPDERPAEHQQHDERSDRDDALLARGEAVPPGAHYFAPPPVLVLAAVPLPMRMRPSMPLSPGFAAVTVTLRPGCAASRSRTASSVAASGARRPSSS